MQPTDTTTPLPPFRRYLRAAAALFLALYLAPAFLLRIPSFEQWGGSSFGPALDYGFQLPHTDADIVIFGDSSAAVGLDPLQMSSALGLKVINLPNTGASLHVVGDLNLKRYLANNKPPRLIVFYFTPWNLDYTHEPAGGRIYEGEEMLIRHGNPRQIANFAFTHPTDTLQFPFRFYSANPPNAVRTALRGEHASLAVAAAMGHADPLSRRPPLTSPCVFPSDLTRTKPSSTAETLLQNYTTTSTETLFYIAPMPACSNVATFTNRSYAQVHTVPPHVLPVLSFKLDFAYTHLLPEAVPAATAALTEAIRARLALPR